MLPFDSRKHLPPIARVSRASRISSENEGTSRYFGSAALARMTGLLSLGWGAAMKMPRRPRRKHPPNPGYASRSGQGLRPDSYRDLENRSKIVNPPKATDSQGSRR